MIGLGVIGGHLCFDGITITAEAELPGNRHGALLGLVGLTNSKQEIDGFAVYVGVAKFGDSKLVQPIGARPPDSTFE